MTMRIIALVAVLAATAPSVAIAQTFTPPVKIGQNVWVTSTEGAEIQGTVSAISSSNIELLTAIGPKRLALDDVAAISKKDSSLDGFLGGAVLGALVGGSVKSPARNDRATLAVAGALIYGTVFGLIDAAIQGRDVIYRRSQPASTVVNIAPIVGLEGPKRVGVGGTITWR